MQYLPLTKREYEVLSLIAFDSYEIAAKLNISYFTVRNHIRHIFFKLGVRSTPAAIIKAIRMEIISPYNFRL